MSAAVAASSGAPVADVEKGAAAADANVDGGGAPAAAVASGEGVVSAVVRRWRRQDLLEKSGSALRVAAWAFSLLAFVVMGANDQGDWRQFEHYEEYR